jgi:hypothetical protein
VLYQSHCSQAYRLNNSSPFWWLHFRTYPAWQLHHARRPGLNDTLWLLQRPPHRNGFL